MEPAYIQSRATGQVVLVQAEHLVDGCWCVFEYLSPALAPFKRQQGATVDETVSSSASITFLNARDEEEAIEESETTEPEKQEEEENKVQDDN